MAKFKARPQTPQEIEAEMEKQKIKKIEEQTTMSSIKYLISTRNLKSI